MKKSVHVPGKSSVVTVLITAMLLIQSIGISAAVVQITVTPSQIDFGNVTIATSYDTTGGTIGNFTVENTGDVNVNVTISATALWAGESKLASDYQFKSSNKESNSASIVVSSWTNLTVADQYVCNVLANNTTSNEVYADIRITVPADEPVGTKSSVITFVAMEAT